MTRFPLRTILTGAALFAGASTGLGQSEASLPVPGVQQVGLLLLPDVQKELKVDAGQADKARGLAGEIQQFMITSIQELQTKPVPERVEGLQAMNTSLAEKTRNGLAGILQEPQLKRLQQISLQERGGMSFVDEEVQQGLKMSDNQKARVRSQVSEAFLKIRQSAVANPGDRQALLNKAQELRKQLTETIVGELTDEQKAAWNEMIGAPFVVKFEQIPAPPADAPVTPR